MEELIHHFSLEGLSKSPAVFDYDKLGWINGEYFKAMDDNTFAAEARSYAGDLPDNLESSWPQLAALLKPDCSASARFRKPSPSLSNSPPSMPSCTATNGIK